MNTLTAHWSERAPPFLAAGRLVAICRDAAADQAERGGREVTLLHQRVDSRGLVARKRDAAA